MPETPEPLPSEGCKAPAFSLPASNGEHVRLSDLRGSHVVLYFYPKDNTPGCTAEAKEFRKLATAFSRLGVALLGISPDTVDSHRKFIEKHKLNFTLLADTDHKTAAKYGVWVEKNLYGRSFWGIRRTTFLIGPEGNIVRVWPKVSPRGHAQEVFDTVRGL